MLYGLTRILSRIKWWITKPKELRHMCKGFCPACEYYELCIDDQNSDYDEDDFIWYADANYNEDDFDWYADADYDYPME